MDDERWITDGSLRQHGQSKHCEEIFESGTRPSGFPSEEQLLNAQL